MITKRIINLTNKTYTSCAMRVYNIIELSADDKNYYITAAFYEVIRDPESGKYKETANIAGFFNHKVPKYLVEVVKEGSHPLDIGYCHLIGENAALIEEG